MKKKFIAVIFLVGQNLNGAASIVYNIKVAETTKRSATDEVNNFPSFATLTIFDQYRKKYSGDRHRIDGAMATYMYLFGHAYARVDFAFANTVQKNPLCSFSRVETDDLLFSAGYGFIIDNRKRVTLSGLFGIPTHKNLSLQEFQFGYAHFALGAQLDGAFTYSDNGIHAFMSAVRFIQFFERKSCVPIDILCESFKFTPGNLTDIFISHRSKWGHHRIEIGYDLSLFLNAKICPTLEDAVARSNYVRSGFFATYKHRFFVHELPSAVTIAFSYAFDQKPLNFGNKRVITTWASWSISF